jgi:hypothetical protein
MPFGSYRDFSDCVSRNKDKASPEGYCANIMRQIEKEELEKGKKELTDRLKAFTVPVSRSRQGA